MAKKWMKFEIKEMSPEGSFEGLLSPYGNLDLQGDVVEPGAFTKTLQEHGNSVPMLWQHKEDRPIGDLVLEDRPDGLWCKGQLLMTIPDAQTAYKLIKARIVKGLSIGYESVKDNVEKGVRHLKEIRLWEGSVVTFGANLQALITSVKSRRETKEDFDEELAEIQLQDLGYQMFSALRCALASLPWASGMTNAEKVAGAEVTLQQFSEAFLTYLPAYLDFLTEEYGSMETMSREQIEVKRAGRKAGRAISAANKTKIQTAVDHTQAAGEHTKCANEIMSALIAEEAVDDTSDGKAAASKTEPAIDHSASMRLLSELKALLKAA